MSRPTETPPGEVAALTDHEVPDFLEKHRVALLAFLGGDAASAKMRGRLSVAMAKWWRPGDQVGAAVVDLERHRLVAEALGVKGAPTVILFHDGEAVDRLMGAVPDAVLDEALSARLRHG